MLPYEPGNFLRLCLVPMVLTHFPIIGRGQSTEDKMAKMEWSGTHIVTWDPDNTPEVEWAMKQLADLKIEDQDEGVILEILGATKLEQAPDGMMWARTEAKMTEVYPPPEKEAKSTE